jgi:hypothetical protein
VVKAVGFPREVAPGIVLAFDQVWGVDQEPRFSLPWMSELLRKKREYDPSLYASCYVILKGPGINN